MNLERKNLVVQLILFCVFFLMGANILLGVFLSDKIPWFSYVMLILLVIGVVFGFMYYRKKDDRTVVVTEKELNILKYLLYGYFLVYIAQMFLPSLFKDNVDLISIISSILLMLIALVGVIIQVKILQVKKG
jgi:MFS family permease